MSTNFVLRRGAAITERYDSAPEDSLGELTPVEMGLWRFCFDHDCRVAVEVGAVETTVFLYFDISGVLDYFPDVLSKVADGEETVLSVPESGFDLKFVPSAGGITCTLSEFGQAVRQTSIEVNREQVFRELKDFYTGIIEQAIALEYIPIVEGQTILTELPQSTR